ncbi:hypothetical protein RRG08_012136 [Elysia crispata]|uniref:Uncharacterized protein n=1 Tax=Elysia crispata TaxID=231223 RepID=A0AAE1ANA4_9GAST|nr:hypothetical protein RRG08_012136 [Elysia crispata]
MGAKVRTPIYGVLLLTVHLVISADDGGSGPTSFPIINTFFGPRITGDSTIVFNDKISLEFPKKHLEQFLECLCNKSNLICSFSYSGNVEKREVTAVQKLGASMDYKQPLTSAGYNCMDQAITRSVRCSVNMDNSRTSSDANYWPEDDPDVCDYKCIFLKFETSAKYKNFGDGPRRSTEDFCVRPSQGSSNQDIDPGSPSAGDKDGDKNNNGDDSGNKDTMSKGVNSKDGGGKDRNTGDSGSSDYSQKEDITKASSNNDSKDDSSTDNSDIDSKTKDSSSNDRGNKDDSSTDNSDIDSKTKDSSNVTGSKDDISKDDRIKDSGSKDTSSSDDDGRDSDDSGSKNVDNKVSGDKSNDRNNGGKKHIDETSSGDVFGDNSDVDNDDNGDKDDKDKIDDKKHIGRNGNGKGRGSGTSGSDSDGNDKGSKGDGSSPRGTKGGGDAVVKKSSRSNRLESITNRPNRKDSLGVIDGTHTIREKDGDSDSLPGNNTETEASQARQVTDNGYEFIAHMLGIALGVSIFVNIVLGAVLSCILCRGGRSKGKGSQPLIKNGETKGVANVRFLGSDEDVKIETEFGNSQNFFNLGISGHQQAGTGISFVNNGFRDSNNFVKRSFNHRDTTTRPAVSTASNSSILSSKRGSAKPISKSGSEAVASFYGNIGDLGEKPSEEIRLPSGNDSLYAVARGNEEDGQGPGPGHHGPDNRYRPRLNTPPVESPQSAEAVTAWRTPTVNAVPLGPGNEYVEGDALWHSSATEDTEAIPTFDDEEPRRSRRRSELAIQLVATSAPGEINAGTADQDGVYCVPRTTVWESEDVYSEI